MDENPAFRLVQKGTVLLAVLAGIALAAITVVTVVSIIGRGLIWVGLGSIPGDFELVEIGCAFVVFGFLPYCHLHRGHVTVDLLLGGLPTPLFNLFTFVGDLSIAAISILICQRLWVGMLEKIAYNETTMILGVPVWIGYAAAFVGAAWAIVVACAVLWRDLDFIRRNVRLT